MNPIIACFECGICAIERGCGFISEERLYCLDRESYVTVEDGCTFGEKGPHPQKIDIYDVDLATSVREDIEKWC